MFFKNLLDILEKNHRRSVRLWLYGNVATLQSIPPRSRLFLREKASECKWKQMCLHFHPTFGVKILEWNYVIVIFIFTCFSLLKKLRSTNRSESYMTSLPLQLLSSLFVTLGAGRKTLLCSSPVRATQKGSAIRSNTIVI